MIATEIVSRLCQGGFDLQGCFVWDGEGYDSQWKREKAFRDYFGDELAMTIGLEYLRDGTYLCVPADWWKANGCLLASAVSGNDLKTFVLCVNSSYIVLPLE